MITRLDHLPLSNILLNRLNLAFNIVEHYYWLSFQFKIQGKHMRSEFTA